MTPREKMIVYVSDEKLLNGEAPIPTPEHILELMYTSRVEKIAVVTPNN
jgi:hypothetical protein